MACGLWLVVLACGVQFWLWLGYLPGTNDHDKKTNGNGFWTHGQTTVKPQRLLETTVTFGFFYFDAAFSHSRTMWTLRTSPNVLPCVVFQRACALSVLCVWMCVVVLLSAVCFCVACARCVVVVCARYDVWCGALKKPPCVPSFAPLCVHSKRPRVCRQNDHMLKHTWACCRYTLRRFECTHRGAGWRRGRLRS